MKQTNVPLAIASLVLSFALWLYVYPQHLEDEDSRQISVKLSYSGLPPNMVVTDIPETILLTAKGDPKRLDEMAANKDLEAVVALAAAKPGRRRYPVTITPGKYRDFFPDRQTTPVESEQIATRTVSVEVETQGQFADPTLTLDDTLVDPPTVAVSGPKSLIERIAKARVPFDLRPITLAEKEPQYPAVEALFANGAVAEGVTLDPKIVKVTPIISSSPQQKQVSVVPTIAASPPVGFIMAGYEVSPPLVTIRGTSRALAGLTQISTDPVDITGVNKTTEFVVNLRVPQGIAVQGSRRAHVRVLINPAPSNGAGSSGSP
jgi:YbbR domain-containing protein